MRIRRTAREDIMRLDLDITLLSDIFEKSLKLKHCEAFRAVNSREKQVVRNRCRYCICMMMMEPSMAAVVMTR